MVFLNAEPTGNHHFFVGSPTTRHAQQMFSSVIRWVVVFVLCGFQAGGSWVRWTSNLLRTSCLDDQVKQVGYNRGKKRIAGGSVGRKYVEYPSIGLFMVVDLWSV